MFFKNVARNNPQSEIIKGFKNLLLFSLIAYAQAENVDKKENKDIQHALLKIFYYLSFFLLVPFIYNKMHSFVQKLESKYKM